MAVMKRARVKHTDTATIKRWRCTDDPNVALLQIISTLGLPSRFLVVRKDPESGNELILSRHRKRGAAIRSIETQTR